MTQIAKIKLCAANNIYFKNESKMSRMDSNPSSMTGEYLFCYKWGCENQSSCISWVLFRSKFIWYSAAYTRPVVLSRLVSQLPTLDTYPLGQDT